jgi:hypothetical protein
MFNSGIRGKRATDGLGFVSSQEKFIQKTFPIPKINSFSVANSDDLALDPAGGQTVEINGLNFESGATIIVGGESISVVTFVNSTKLTFTSPAKASGSYTVFVTNPNGGTAILVPGLVYSGLPTFTTSAGSLGTYTEVTTIDEVIQATEGADPITYSLVSGSLPAGATLNSAGYITGTAPVDNSSNTYTFTIRATDSELQDSTREFSLTINTDVVTWSTPSAGTVDLIGDQAMSNVTLLATAASGYSVSYTANTLPNNVFLTGNTVYGTPNTDQTVVTTFTATAANTNRTATRTVTWVVTLSDQFFKQTVLAINADSGNTWITDSSTNGLGITPTGDTRPSAFSPYNTVWSNYFDGTGDSLTRAFTSTTDGMYLQGSTYTIEAWVYPNALTGTQYIYICNAANVASFGYNTLYLSGTSVAFATRVATSGTEYARSGGTLTVGQWSHIAVSVNSNVAKLFLNGVQIGDDLTIAPNTFTPTGAGIGRNQNGAAGGTDFNGYISNLRVVQSTAVYTSAFTPPTAPLTAITNTSLLTCQSNRFVDNSTNNFTITRNGDVTVSSFGPFTETDATTGSGYFDGTGDYLSATSNAAFGYGTGDFTIEFWLYLNSTVLQTTFSNLTSDTSTNPHIYINTSIRYYTAGADRITGTSLVVGQWYHIALVRASGSTRLYINGTQSGSTYTDSNNYGTTAPLGIGTYWNAGSLVTTNTANGYFSNIRVVKGTAVYTSNFTPPTSPLTAISNTSLLTLQNRLGHNNNTFLDTSGNKFNITRNGNTTQGTFSPFSLAAGQWSNYFDGNGDYLSVADNAALDFGSGSFTIEAWIYLTSYNTQSAMLINKDYGNPSTYQPTWRAFTFTVNYSGGVYSGLDLTLFNSTTFQSFSTTGVTLNLNTWYHVAAVRNGNAISIYVNGVSYASGTATIGALNDTVYPVYIGVHGYTIGDTNQTFKYFPGYISNVRVVKGTAVYTSNFTPSTTPLTAITNTSLLTCQSNRFVDNSTNAFAITRNGDVRVTPFSPFAPTAAYSAGTNGGSGYFDGSGDYLTVPDNAAWAFGSGDFTVEAFFYREKDGTQFIVSQQDNSSATGSAWIMSLNSSSQLRGILYYGNAAYDINSSTALAKNQWVHVAIVRTSSTFSVYENGVRVATTNVSTSSLNDSSQTVAIGARNNGNDAVGGYLSNVRIIKGSGPYDATQATLTVPTAPLTAITNTSLLCNFTNAGIIDNTGKNNLETVGNAQIDTTTKKFGTGSLEFDGNGDYLLSPSTPLLGIDSGDFTIECWVYFNSVSGFQCIYDLRSVQPSSAPLVYIAGNSRLNYLFNSSTPVAFGPNPLTTGTWYHVAWVRSGSTHTLYVDGQSQATFTSTAGVSSSAITVGARQAGGAADWLNGYIDDLRITKGVARYTSNFSVPTSTFRVR